MGQDENKVQVGRDILSTRYKGLAVADLYIMGESVRVTLMWLWISIISICPTELAPAVAFVAYSW